MKSPVRTSNAQVADSLQRGRKGNWLYGNQASLYARAHFVTKIVRLEGGGTQTVFDLRADPKPRKNSPAPPRIERGHRVSDSFRRLKNKQRLAASLPHTPTRKIVESQWRGDGPSRTDASANPFHRVVERLTAHAAYDAYRRQIRAMADLPEGWDTYSAKPLGKAAVSLALQFVNLLEKRRLSVAWIAPTVDDSIMAVLNTDEVRQEWEFYSDGDTAVMIQKTGGEKQYLDLDATEFASHLPR